MIFACQIEILYYRCLTRQHGRGFGGALTPVIGRNTLPLLRKSVVPAAICKGTNVLKLALPETAHVGSYGKIFKI